MGEKGFKGQPGKETPTQNFKKGQKGTQGNPGPTVVIPSSLNEQIAAVKVLGQKGNTGDKGGKGGYGMSGSPGTPVIIESMYIT